MLVDEFFVRVCARVCMHTRVLSQLRTDSDDEKIDRKKNDKIIECHRAKTIMFMINEFFLFSFLEYARLEFAQTEWGHIHAKWFSK